MNIYLKAAKVKIIMNATSIVGRVIFYCLYFTMVLLSIVGAIILPQAFNPGKDQIIEAIKSIGCFASAVCITTFCQLIFEKQVKASDVVVPSLIYVSWGLISLFGYAELRSHDWQLSDYLLILLRISFVILFFVLVARVEGRRK